MKIKNKSVIKIMKGPDNMIVDLITDRGEILPATPTIRNTFAIFEPIILPTTIFPNPFLAAAIVTPSSGREVPIAIKLNPTTV